MENLKEKYDFESMDYEQAVQIIEEQNNQLIDMFAQTLKDKGLSDKTIQNHCFNVDFCLNYYLVHDDYNTFDDGLDMLDGFFSDFFKRKAMWSSQQQSSQPLPA